MCAQEDSLIPLTSDDAKALTDEVWNLVNAGLQEDQRGTDLGQEAILVKYIGNKYGCSTMIQPITSLSDLKDTNFKHKIFALNLVPIFNINSNHFLKESPEGDYGGFVHVQDSEEGIDYGNDIYPEISILQGAEVIFGLNNQFGWKFNWTKS